MSYMGVFSQTFEEMLKKAEKQDAAAQCAVGLSYLKGLNVKKMRPRLFNGFNIQPH